MKVIGKALWVILCVIIFISVFAVSIITGLAGKAGITGSSFTLQNEAADAVRYKGEVLKETLDIQYITNEGSVETRQILVYRPANAEGDIPLVYVPHYAVEENSADFQQYMSHGWAAASPVFQEQYNGQLTGNDLVFNNAALYTLRSLDGIDTQRIAIVGGSAGGYMALMLSELQMGTCATIANSPIANVYYNLYVHFPACDEVNRNSSFFDIPIPIQLLVSKSFRVNLENFPDATDADRWAELSPLGMAKCVSNPVVINHYTGDILVPVDQISKRYTYKKSDGTLPDYFPFGLGNDYPGILSHSLEEEANAEELSVERYALENQYVDMIMPYSKRLLTLNIFDDGPMSAKGSHTAPGTTGTMDTIPYLEEMFSRTLAGTEKLIPKKLLLLLERYYGDSKQLPAHVGINDTIYGSLAIYQQEVVEELTLYARTHSLEELDASITSAIKASKYPDLETVWQEIRVIIMNELI